MDDQAKVDSIYQEVAKRRARAFELGIPKLIGGLYATLRFYPAWQRNVATGDHVCTLVTDIVSHGERGVGFTLLGKMYKLEFRRKPNYLPDDDDGMEFADLDLFCNSKKVLSLRMVLDSLHPEWSAVNVSAFIEGEWIDDFRTLRERMEKEKAEREQRDRCNPERLNALKKDFGIE